MFPAISPNCPTASGVMMLDYDQYQTERSPMREARRARDAWRRIQRRPTEIVVARGDDDLPAQIVRIELKSTSSGTPEIVGGAGASGKLAATVFGVKGHPSDDVPDTDLLRDDRFVVGVQWFRVIDVIQEVGEIQAIVEAQS